MELGQMLFSNNQYQEYEAEWAIDGINMIAEHIQQMRGDQGTISSNFGELPYESNVFTMRTYCWCDGDREGHEDICPPNFEHYSSGLVINWYKHSGRGITSNKELSIKEWFNVIKECIESLDNKK